jgi:hypothetical protein
VGIKANRGWMDQFEDRFGTHRDAHEVEAGDFFTKSCVGKTESYTDVGMGKLGSILRVCLLVVAVLTGIMIGSSAVSNENSFVGSLNLMLSLFDLMGALILLKLDRQTEK